MQLNAKVEKATGLLITALVFFIIFCRGISTPADYDLWGHLRFGLDILKLGNIPHYDQYSYLLQDGRWINHEWLSETTLALFYKTWGVVGLVALKCFCVVSIAILLWRVLYRSGFSMALSSGILLFIEVMLLPATATMRPNIIGCLLLTAELLILSKCTNDASRGRASHWLWFLPPLFVVWANAHGSFVLGLVIFALWWCFSLFEFTTSKSWSMRTLSNWLLVTALPITVLATLLNPYGAELWHLLLTTATVPRPDITEWQPLGVNHAHSFYYLFTVLLSVLALIWSRKTKHLGIIAAWIVLACSPQDAFRFLPLFAIGTVILIGPHLADSANRAYSYLKQKPIIFLLVQFMVAFVIFISAAGIRSQLLLGAPGQIVVPADIPVRAVALLKQSKIQANALVDFNWGEYCIWHLSPEIKVAVDGRRETVYPDNLRNLYTNFSTGCGDWDTLLEKYPTDIVLMGPSAPATNLMRLKSGWITVYSDQNCCMFARKNSEIEKILSQIHLSNKQTLPNQMLYFP